MSVQPDMSLLVEKISASGSFDEEWYLQTYPDVSLSGLEPIEHYLKIGAWLGREPNPNFSTADYLRENPEIVGKDILPFVHSITPDERTEGRSGEVAHIDYAVMPVDDSYYALNNPDVSHLGESAEAHFTAFGYKELRNPCAQFDNWWYTQNYLLGTPHHEGNAFAHYNQVGAAQGNLPRPPLPVTFKPQYSRKLESDARRICLFAAYDGDGIVDDYVLDYLRDLALHADIYYLSDGPMDSTELAKLDGLVKGAWAQRHGMYDFGSWSILARDLVGWDVIEQYDELVFANDSCYRVHPLKDTFETMAQRSCAWWGLQATKGLHSTMHQNRIPDDAPLTMTDVKKKHLSSFEADPVYDFHIGSYFLAFRKDVINDPAFRRVIDNVSKETSKLRIIRKYEIGLTRFLIGHGYEFDTLVDTLTKEHPIFTERAFDLVDEGFPFLKRFFLTENHYHVEGLAQWTYRLKQANPDIDTVQFEKNLLRVGDATKLYNNFHITKNPVYSRPPRTHDEMHHQDHATPKYDHWWAFPVCSYSHLFSDNTRAVFERVKDDPSIKKIILTRSAHIEVDGANVVIAPLHSYEGQSYLLRARHFFLRHGVGSNVGYPLSSELHEFHNLWHGIPLKRIGYTSLDQLPHLDRVATENERLRSVIASSDVDRLAMTAAYWPMNFHNVWVTGLPRHDLILMDEEKLPADFHVRSERLKTRLKGKKFLLFAPTFRADQASGYYRFNEAEVARLSEWLKRNNIVMGIREHMADTTRLYSSQLVGDCFFDASERHYPDIELLYRHADSLLTDYSSCFIDYMLTGRPMVSFAFDKDSYASTQRGLFYEMDRVFPGPICTSFEELMAGLETSLKEPSASDKAGYKWKTDFFHKYQDDRNSDRVVEKVREVSQGSTLLWERTKLPDERQEITFVYSETYNTTNRYRIFNLAAAIRELGWNVRIVEEQKVTPNELQSADVMFICRVAMSETLSDLCETFRLQGGKIIFDMVDMIHDISAFAQSEYFRKHPELASDFSVLSTKTRQMIETADLITVTTPALAESIERIGKQVEVIPNALSSAIVNRFGPISKPSKHKEEIRICYLAGSAIHLEDFAECREALTHIMKAHPKVELHIVGQLDVNELKDDQAAIAAICHDEMPYDAMHDFMSGMDINLAPLSPSEFNDAESEAKIFEAALHGVPTIASPTRSYANAIQDSQNGMLAKTVKEWEAALEKLITDTNFRNELGMAAHQEIASKFEGKSSARLLAGALNALVAVQTPKRDAIP